MGLRDLCRVLPLGFYIDTIKSYSRKNGRIEKIKELFELRAITDNARVSSNLKKKIKGNNKNKGKKNKGKTITGGLYAPNAPFSFAILKDNRNDYRFAYFIAYSLKSYKEHKELSETAKETLDKLFTICPPSSIDICFDTPNKPNVDAFRGIIDFIGGYYRQEYTSHYINNPANCTFERILLYDKAAKDGLKAPLWRIEFRLPVNVSLRLYEPPIEEMERVIEALTT